jgi:HEAT repeat protein
MFIADFKDVSRRCARKMKALVTVGLAATLLSGCASGVEDRIKEMYSLARRPSDRNKDRIEARFRDPDRDVRATALVVMDTIDQARAKRLAASALYDPDGLVRAAAVTIAGPGADPATMRILLALAVDDPFWQVRSRALEAIVPTEDPAVREPFARALADGNRHVRQAALRAGVAHPGLLPLDELSRLVASDPDWENRVDAARVLGASKDPQAYAGLDAALRDPNAFVRMTAAEERAALEAAGVPH